MVADPPVCRRKCVKLIDTICVRKYPRLRKQNIKSSNGYRGLSFLGFVEHGVISPVHDIEKCGGGHAAQNVDQQINHHILPVCKNAGNEKRLILMI